MIVEHIPVGLLACNCIVLGDEKTGKAIVIDPGDDIDKIEALLSKHGLTVTAILATHAHIDHVGGLALLKERTGAPALIHEADVPLYEALAAQAEWLGVPAPPVGEIDKNLVDGGSIDFGRLRVDVRHTPGHTPGSVSLVLPQDKPVVFSGDTLFAGSIGRTDLWGGNFDDIMRSIRGTLMALPDEALVVPGHGPETTIGAERRTNPFITK
ncbi:MAG TPA: MBL fold metallo-hydrolase [Candidatus Tumulicola sp.]|nr:MBL fold metallo-hydrolase [Candidatus Tumulicola sp.]